MPQDTDAHSSRDPIDDALAECLRRAPEDRAAALEAACAAFPDRSDELLQRYETLARLGLDEVVQATEPGDEDVLRRFDDFELGEILGVGGMGVVHLARQVSLDREVVVKLVRPDLLHFANARDRFRREAEAVARLQHPGIVPIHVVGEHAGVPYFAMEAVDGRTLADVLEDLADRAPERLDGSELAPAYADRSWVDACLDVAGQIGDALQHAHDRGILHRDVKPSNALVTVDGRVRLVDFGLHVARDAGAETGAERVTREGATPGTLMYMAPEQLERGTYDERSEVYALGATLYELLTLQAPFRGEDRTTIERMIRAGVPDAIRPRNRAVRTDVEAVVMKALSVEPQRRYPSVSAFTADVRRAVAGEPVEARPDGALYRLRRWATRQPALAGASAALVVVLITAPTIVIVQQRNHAQSLELALKEETAARVGAEDLTRFVVDVLEAGDPNLADPDPAVRRILERSRARMDALLGQSPARRAVVESVLGRIYGNLGLWEEGVEMLASSLGVLEDRVETLEREGAPDEKVWIVRNDLAEARSRLASLLEVHGRTVEAYEQRRLLAGDLAATRGADSWQARQARAEVVRLGSRVRPEQLEGHVPPTPDEVGAALTDAVEAIEAADDVRPHDRAKSLGWLGSYLGNRAQTVRGPAQAPAVARARAVLERCRAAYVDSGRDSTIEYADASSALGVVLRLAADHVDAGSGETKNELLDRAEAMYSEAAAIYERRLPPDDYRAAGVLVNLGGLVIARGRPGEAVDSLEKALTIFTRVFGETNRYTVQTEGTLLGALYLSKRTEGLAERYGPLIEHQLVAFDESHPALRTSYERRAILRRAAGDVDDALVDLEELRRLTALAYGENSKQVERVETFIDETLDQ